jgi:hypothetical protein
MTAFAHGLPGDPQIEKPKRNMKLVDGWPYAQICKRRLAGLPL